MDRSRREARLQRKQADKRQGQLKTLGVVAIGAVIVVVLMIYASRVLTPDLDLDYSSADGSMVGDPDAPVTIVEYVDFQCSFCYNSYISTDPPLFENHITTGEVLFEYRLVDFLGPESSQAAEAAYCAADQNLFWQYRDVVWANYPGDLSDARLIGFAESVEGLDVESFSACLDSDEKASVIEANRAAAQADGVTGTPSFIINGTQYAGAQPYETLEGVIEGIVGN